MTRLFGTNGVRGTVNEDMDSDLALRLGMAIGTWIGKGKEVSIGTDTRRSNYMLKNAVSSGLMATGCDVIDVGEVPTPALQYHTREKSDFGIAITASHNPPEFNGIKCVDHDGTELIEWMEEKIEEIYFSEEFELVEWDEVGQKRSEDALKIYFEAIEEKIDKDVIADFDPKIILDCANGAGCYLTPYLLRELGCEVVTLNAQPDGSFPGHNSEPTEENLKDLIELTSETKADMGIAHDGDADRTIFIDEDGEFIHGDKILTLLAKKFIEENDGGIVVTPVSSSSSVKDVVENNGGTLIYTAVGSPIVARKMKEEGAVFGGEENGGLIFAEHQYCRDAAMTAAKIVELVSKEGSLSGLIEQLPQYALQKKSVYCEDGLKGRLLEILKDKYGDQDIDDTDGLKIFYEDGWVLIRPSGTEPKYRIYAEAPDQKTTEELAEKHREEVRQALQTLK